MIKKTLANVVGLAVATLTPVHLYASETPLYPLVQQADPKTTLDPSLASKVKRLVDYVYLKGERVPSTVDPSAEWMSLRIQDRDQYYTVQVMNENERNPYPARDILMIIMGTLDLVPSVDYGFSSLYIDTGLDGRVNSINAGISIGPNSSLQPFAQRRYESVIDHLVRLIQQTP